ncbi:MAG: helix-turn-helix domain-containing protein [Dokdonella sp.]
MDRVWKHEMPHGQKLMMLALCDRADDIGGSCYPSMATLAKMTGVTLRHAKRVVHELIASGYVDVIGNKSGGAPGSSCQFQINIDRIKAASNVTPHAVGRVTSAAQTGDIGDIRRVTSNAKPAASNVTQYVRKATKDKQPKKQPAMRAILALPSWLPADAWNDWDQHRREKSARGWTTGAMSRSIRDLDKLREKGFAPEVVIDNAIRLGWTGLYEPRSNSPACAPTSSLAGASKSWAQGEQQSLDDSAHALRVLGAAA